MNRPHGWLDYQERLGRVVAYLHDHLGEDIGLDRLAEVAHLSPYHWHRVYHGLYGETIAATLRRVRLHRGAGYLANTALPVAEVARRCGYPNAQSFTRAFRQAYGSAPAAYRAAGAHAAFRLDQDLPPGDYQVEIRSVPRLRLAGLDHRGPYMLVGKAFEAAYARLQAQGLAHEGMRCLAVYHDDPSAVPEAQLDARAGFTLPAGAKPRPPLVGFELGGIRCAVLRYRGPYASMHAAYRWLFGHWLVRSGLPAAHRPVFEEYLNHPRDTAAADLLTDIFLPLAAR
ncbi:MAG: AraC family transcriptional regulator [Pseudomonadota bacterium]